MLPISRQPMIISDAALAKFRLASRAHPMLARRVLLIEKKTAVRAFTVHRSEIASTVTLTMGDTISRRSWGLRPPRLLRAALWPTLFALQRSSLLFIRYSLPDLDRVALLSAFSKLDNVTLEQPADSDVLGGN